MRKAGKRPCSICRQWFRPEPRVRNRQHACGKPECQALRRQKTQASWRRRNRGYALARRIDQRAAQPSEPLRMPAPLDQLPWDVAKDQFGPQGTDFIAVMGALIVRSAKDQWAAYRIDPARLPGTLPLPPRKTSPGFSHTEPAGHDATGISPTRPALGTSTSPPAAPARAVDGLTG